MKRIVLIFGLFFIQCQEILTVPNISFEHVKTTSPGENTIINQETIHFLWEEIPHATQYKIQLLYLKDSIQQKLVFDTIVSGISYRDSIKTNGTYRFRIRAENSAYETAYTTTNFQINLPHISTSNTSLLFPRKDAEITSSDVTFSWENIVLASQYRFQLAHPNFNEATSLLVDSIIQHPRLQHKLPMAGNYSWRVRGENNTGVGDYSEGQFNFTNPFLEELPILLFPQRNQILSDTRVRFKWNEIPLAEEYQFQLVRPNFNAIEEFILDSIVSNPQLEYTLSDQNTYGWRVRGLNATAETNYSSNPFSIAVQASIASNTINLLAPSNGSSLNSTMVNFNWEALEGADQYHIQVATPRFNNANQILVDQRTNQPFITATLVATSTYEWRVRAENNNSVSAYSSAQFLIQ